MNDDTDTILQSEMSDEDIIVSLASLCRHRGNCMDLDQQRVDLLKRLGKNQEFIIKNLEQQLKMERQLPGLSRWMIAINNWAKS